MVGTKPMVRPARRMDALQAAAAGASTMTRMRERGSGAAGGMAGSLKKAPNVFTFVIL